jgi:Domain of unknown function (DUF4158)
MFPFVDNFSILRLPLKNNENTSPPSTPFFGHLSWSLPRMASIERTAYPRFKPSLTANELQTLYEPTEEERDFVSTHAREAAQQLTLLMLLKCQ